MTVCLSFIAKRRPKNEPRYEGPECKLHRAMQCNVTLQQIAVREKEKKCKEHFTEKSLNGLVGEFR